MKLKIILFSALLLVGCGSFSQIDKEQDNDKTLSLPDMQNINMVKAYETAATRAVTKMLDDSSDLYEVQPRPKIYIKQTQKTSPNLPDGFYTARQTMKQIINGSGTYVVVNNMEDANFLLDSTVSQFAMGDLPAILFRLSLNNQDNQPVRAWSVVIKQLPEDQSWW